MVHANQSDTEKKEITILMVLSESSQPLGSIIIARELEHYVIHLSERGVRYHLKVADERGYTQSLGRDGRMLTSLGFEDLKIAQAPVGGGPTINAVKDIKLINKLKPQVALPMHFRTEKAALRFAAVDDFLVDKQGITHLESSTYEVKRRNSRIKLE